MINSMFILLLKKLNKIQNNLLPTYYVFSIWNAVNVAEVHISEKRRGAEFYKGVKIVINYIPPGNW